MMAGKSSSTLTECSSITSSFLGSLDWIKGMYRSLSFGSLGTPGFFGTLCICLRRFKDWVWFQFQSLFLTSGIYGYIPFWDFWL